MNNIYEELKTELYSEDYSEVRNVTWSELGLELQIEIKSMIDG